MPVAPELYAEKIEKLPFPRLVAERERLVGEFARLRLGNVPEDMDDRWFWYFDPEGSELRFHRSWTGFCAYAARVEPFGTGYMVTDVVVNRSPKQVNVGNGAPGAPDFRSLVAAALGWDADGFNRRP